MDQWGPFLPIKGRERAGDPGKGRVEQNKASIKIQSIKDIGANSTSQYLYGVEYKEKWEKEFRALGKSADFEKSLMNII